MVPGDGDTHRGDTVGDAGGEEEGNEPFPSVLSQAQSEPAPVQAMSPYPDVNLQLRQQHCCLLFIIK